MDNLPKSGNTSHTPSSGTAPIPSVGVSGISKEIEPAGKTAESPFLQEVGKEEALPSEVVKAGVFLRSDTVTLPKAVEQLGVKPAPSVISPPTPIHTTTLPLTDEQIAQGLHKSLFDSWRWLAQWCVRRLEQLQVKMK